MRLMIYVGRKWFEVSIDAKDKDDEKFVKAIRDLAEKLCGSSTGLFIMWDYPISDVYLHDPNQRLCFSFEIVE